MAANGRRRLLLKLLEVPVRHLPRPVLNAGAGALFMMSWLMPRRLPDLRRFAASDKFRALRAGALEFTTAQFSLIETGAPWLDPVGRRVDDFCQVRMDKGFDFRRAAIGFECHRSVTSVYGADGSATARLADLEAVLRGAGWGDFFCYGAMLPSRPETLTSAIPLVSAQWQRSPLPSGQEAVPPAGVHLARLANIGWTSRGQPADPKWTLDGRWRAGSAGTDPEPPGAASSFHHPVESHYSDISVLTARALAGHEHAIAIRIPICYYDNPDMRRHPIRRRILPAFPRRPG